MVYWLTRIATWLAARTPRAIRSSVAGAFAVLVYYAWAAKRRVTIANMAQILGATPDDPRAHRLARASWRNYGRYAADFLWASGRGEPALKEMLARLRDVTPPPGAFGAIDVARARGKGLIIVSAHFGNWDVAGMLVANHCPLHVVVERFADERMDALVQSQRRGLGMEVLWMEKSPRQMLRVLQQNGVVAIIVDRSLSPGEGVPVTFFGRRCYVPGGVAQLAQLSGASIMAGWGRYDERGSTAFYGGLTPPIPSESTGDRKADTQRLTQRIYEALEEIIHPFPDQWYMFRPFWPEEGTSGEAADASGGGGRMRQRKTLDTIQGDTQGDVGKRQPSRVRPADVGARPASPGGARDG
jgi:lauroyl/myristoyl acyltransferase